MNKYDLEERLINFSVLIIEIVNNAPKTLSAKTLSNQIIRSGISVSLNYGEAQSADSPKDFVHKLKIILKELRESHINLKITQRSNSYNNEELISKALIKCNELISIFVKSVKTSQLNQIKNRKS